MAQPRIAVIGAGIGGLTTAVALAREGFRCTVFEREETLPVTGGGIQLSPNATAALRRLGLAAALTGAVRPVARELRRWQDNEVIGRLVLGRAAELRYGGPYCTLRRAALCRALFDAARRVQGADAILFGRRCVGVGHRGDGVVIRFDDGSEHRADAVIGADGINSVVRAALHAGPVRYSGHSVYRAVCPAERVPWLAAPQRVVVWLGPGRHCVAYPIDGGRTLNLVATVPEPVPPRAIREVSRNELLTAYAGWHPAVRGLFAVAGRFDHHGLFDRPPLPVWQRGRVAVLGDAAHPMLPFAAQGAAQAIEDAEALARCLSETGAFPRGGPSAPTRCEAGAFARGEPDASTDRGPSASTRCEAGAFAPSEAGAFASYEAVRRPRVERVAALARDGLREHHLVDGAEQRLRDDRLARGEPADLDWLYRDGRRRAAPVAR